MSTSVRSVVIVSLSTYTSSFYDGKLRALGEQGVETFAVAGDAPDLWGRDAGSRTGPGYSVAVLRIRCGVSRATSTLVGLKEIVRRRQPSLIHIEAEPWQCVAGQGVHLARTMRVPVGVQFAENGPQLRGPLGLVRREAARAVLRRCSYAVGWSKGSSEIARKLAPRLRVETFPGTGVTPPEVLSDSDALRWYGDNSLCLPRVAFIGRFAPEKGILDFLEISDRLATTTPIRVALAGDGPNRSDVEEWTRNRPWASFHGVLSRPEAIEMMALGDVLVCPSRTSPTVKEQFGQAAVEAMASATPVFAYDCGALSEVIGDGGVVRAEGDSAGLAHALLSYFAGTESDRARLREQAVAQAANFSDQAVAGQLVALWSSTVAGGDGNRRPVRVFSQDEDLPGLSPAPR